MENLTTEQHAKIISEAVLYERYQEALKAFEHALGENCDPSSLLADIGAQIGTGRALIRIAAPYIAGKIR